MELDFKKELARKGIHILTLLILVIYLAAASIFSRKIAMLILVLLLIIDLEFEYFRVETSKKIPVISTIWQYLRRDKEANTIGGDVFFLIGSIIVLSIFDLRIAAAAILMTTFGDMAAALIGKRFGRHKIKWIQKKSWEGVIAELITDIIVVLIVLSWNSFSQIYSPQIWIIGITMSVTATFIETIITKLDDNLFIPVFSGFFGQIASYIIKSLA